MTRIAFRNAAELTGSMLLMAFAALIAAVSTIAIIILIPANLMVIAGLFGAGDFPTRIGPMGPAEWLTAAWFPAALIVAIRNGVDSLALFTRPDLALASKMAAWSLAVLLTFPRIWGVAL